MSIMENKQENKQVIKALINVQKEFEPPQRDGANKFANYKYTTLDAILKALIPITTKHKLFISQEPVSKVEDGQTFIGIVTRVFHESGEVFESEPFFIKWEQGAKMNGIQSTGSIITYLKRYTLCALLGINSDDDDDGVSAGYNNQPKGNQYNNQQQYQKPQQQPQQQASPEQQKQQLINQLQQLGTDIASVSQWIAEQNKVSNISEVPVNVQVQYLQQILQKKAGETK